MREFKTIQIEAGVNYLNQSNVLTQLPSNCLFDKGKVGCGGTTLALTSNDPYVVCVPFVSLITNKVSQSNNRVFGFYGGVSKSELMEYLESTECPKIMVTYDSLEKMTNWINPQDYKLLVDEYHILFNHYSFREEAIHSLLNTYAKYKEYCFMTATPLEEDFILEELKDLPMVEAKWNDTMTVKVNTVQCKNVLATTCGVIKKFLDRPSMGNAYFFVNSVEFIKDAVAQMGLTEENCRVIYSKNNKTQVGIKNGDTLDKVKTINFLTSTCFEGSDVYDENGWIFIVSDNRKSNTLLDISTSIQQIAGRIRNTKHFEEISHIYSRTRYSHISYEEFKENTNKGISDTTQIVSEWNGLSDMARQAIPCNFDDSYVRRDGTLFAFDPNKVKLDLYNFKITNALYSVRINIGEEYKKYGFEPISQDGAKLEIEIKDKTTESFKDVIEKLMEVKDSGLTHTALLNKYSERYDFLREAVNKLGYDTIVECGCIMTNVKRKLINLTDVSTNIKVLKALKLNVNPGDFVTNKALKNRLKVVYMELGITKSVKATDINIYFEAKPTSKRVNGKVTKGFNIIRSKFTV